MNHARFWTGLVFLGGLPMGLVLEVVNESVPIESTLEGRVRCNGRLLTQGVVYFYSQDSDRGSDVIAPINPDGTFSCRPVWPGDDGSRVRFKVHVYPGMAPEKFSAMPSEPVPSSAIPTQPVPSIASPSVPATVGPSSLILGAFDVSLGPEPTYVEIDLKD